MSKLIVFCADGTWDGPVEVGGKADGAAPTAAPACKPDRSNVCKLFAWLRGELQPPGTPWGQVEMERALFDDAGNTVQMAKYIHGVGDSSNRAIELGEGAFGVGVVARIARGYTYISRNYKPGDRIVIVGFSRGAYTARALAGLIAGQGLLQPALAALNDSDRYDTAAAAWFRWRHSQDSMFQRVVDGITEFVEMHHVFKNAKPLSDASFISAPIQAVAVWDTVGALGIPAYLGDKTIDLFRFVDTKLSERIAIGIHAIALDERRIPYTPTLWDSSPRVTQFLFPGGHADIGGGYTDHGLSDGPLQWIVERLQQADIGVAFNVEHPVEIKADPQAPRHREWVATPAWDALGIAARSFPSGLPVNSSVGSRMNGQPENLKEHAPGEQAAPYKPGNLPH